MSSRLHVVAGALFDRQGRVLIAQRPPGSHMAGDWEFPGGKVDRDETPRAALERELAEELGVRVGEAELLVRYPHRYPDREVLLELWRVTDYSGTPLGREGQAIRWVALDALAEAGILDADRPMIEALQRVDEAPRA